MHASLRFGVLATVVALAACAEQQPPSPPPPPREPSIEGNTKSVSAADIRAILSLMRKHLIQSYGSALPVYSIRVVDRNHAEVHYWPDRNETIAFTERINGKWRLANEIERIIITNANLPLGSWLPTGLTNR